ncbi:MAG: hypothetical protein RL685_1040 [Pseudomonadota bacterium]|jgi:hypothetical protein
MMSTRATTLGGRFSSIALMGGLWVATGCSLMVDTSQQQCATNLDCQIRGIEFAEAMCVENLCQTDPTWACTAAAEVPPAQTAVNATLQVSKLLDRTPAPGVRATLYSAFDFQLSNPVGAGDTDADGKVSLAVPDGFNGFIYMTAEGVIEPTILYPTLPVSESAGFGPAFVGAPGDTSFLVNLLGATPQPERGTVLMSARDCQGSGGPGAKFDFEGDMGGSQVFYAFNGLASTTATSLDETGQAGIVNVKPGVVGLDLHARDKSVSSMSVYVRSDTVTWATLLPGRLTSNTLVSE